MYLKSIEVQGFKSFANKIHFEFHNGITCIVGPNGSGKSNVSDAVRWVLGEQSAKQLRGSNMQDVIFAGTENRKPLGYAMVSITLDNADRSLHIDFDEVTVTRRVYRSGESEYLLNGTACRLKDINELFYDTGIGKEGYSIIGQGQIERILSTKPEDRRELFDEAAGIVKFKRRKAATLKKLDHEQQNMVRVKDILTELEKQVGPLERQSKAARTYLQLKEELKGYDLTVFLMEQKTGEETLRTVEQNIDIAEHSLEEENVRGEKLRTDYESVQEQLAGLQEIYQQKQETLRSKAVEKGEAEGQVRLLEEQIRSILTEKERLETAAKELAEKKEARSRQLEENKAAIAELQQKRAELLTHQADISYQLEQADVRIGQFSQSAEEQKQKMFQLMNEKSALAVKVQRLDTMLEQNQIRKAEISRKLLGSMGEEERVQSGIDSCKASYEQGQQILQKAVEDNNRLYEELNRLTAEQKKKTQEQSESQRAYHVLHSRLETLQNLAERYEGYGNSIRRIMEVKNRYPGIHGAVADIIQTEKKYEVAIETALGGTIQNIITDTEQTAKELVQYLKQNKYGRATFLPLDGVSGAAAFHRREVLQEKGVIGVASDLVQADACYEAVVRQLLGRNIVVDTLENALAVARKYHHSLRIVTLEGELLQAGGSITGGAYKNNSNLLGRRRELEELDQKSKAEKTRLEELRNILSQMERQIEQLQKERNSTQQKMQEYTLSCSEVKLRLEQLEKELTEIQEGRIDATREKRQMENQMMELNMQKEQLTDQMDTLEDASESSRQEMDTDNEKMESERMSRQELSGQLSSMQVEQASVSQQITFLHQTEERLLQEEEEEKRQFVQMTENQSGGATAIAEKQAQIAVYQQTIEQCSSESILLEQQIAENQEQRQDLTNQQNRFFQEREASAEQIALLDRELLRLNNQKEKTELKLAEQVEYIWNEYELRPSEAEKYRREGDIRDVSGVKKAANALKNQIRALGSVNVGAIEQYKEVSERYQFMKQQYDDLVSAEESLKNIITQLDEGMRKQFAEKFVEIQKEFNKVFRELFGGGNGTLELMEGEDIIEAGIRINSQPPGKKLQNMMQLSGGEKSLTAIALLFAIQNLKPSPFCLLDEIEAALDDANVVRFAGYLHKLTKNTQFIVISHRRGTMTAADRLYGITMQEKGVSTLVSVNLIEDKLDE